MFGISPATENLEQGAGFLDLATSRSEPDVFFNETIQFSMPPNYSSLTDAIVGIQFWTVGQVNPGQPGFAGQLLQEQHTEDEFLELGCIHLAAQDVGRFEQERFKLGEGDLLGFQAMIRFVSVHDPKPSLFSPTSISLGPDARQRDSNNDSPWLPAELTSKVFRARTATGFRKRRSVAESV